MRTTTEEELWTKTKRTLLRYRLNVWLLDTLSEQREVELLNELATLSDKQLLRIRGLGPKGLADFRSRYGAAAKGNLRAENI